MLQVGNFLFGFCVDVNEMGSWFFGAKVESKDEVLRVRQNMRMTSKNTEDDDKQGVVVGVLFELYYLGVHSVVSLGVGI